MSDASSRAFIFEAEPIESDVWDVMIELKLTETVIAGLDDNGLVTYKVKAEPPRQAF